MCVCVCVYIYIGYKNRQGTKLNPNSKAGTYKRIIIIIIIKSHYISTWFKPIRNYIFYVIKSKVDENKQIGLCM